MREAARIAELRAEVAAARTAGKRVALVATMGALHAGHLRPVERAHRHADIAVLSAFVNPLQFGPAEDFARYPRDPAGDASLAVGSTRLIDNAPLRDRTRPGAA